jgi:hypothetical protein
MRANPGVPHIDYFAAAGGVAVESAGLAAFLCFFTLVVLVVVVVVAADLSSTFLLASWANVSPAAPVIRANPRTTEVMFFMAFVFPFPRRSLIAFTT